MQRKLVVACAVTGLVFCAGVGVSKRQNGVSVRVLDKRLKIDELRLFIGTNVDYSYVPPFRQPQYQCQRLVDALGITKLPWKRYDAPKVLGDGPALVIRGRLEVGNATELYLVREGQFDTNPYNTFPGKNGFGNKSAFVLECPLHFLNDFGEAFVIVTNGVFHLKQIGDSNTLAVISIR